MFGLLPALVGLAGVEALAGFELVDDEPLLHSETNRRHTTSAATAGARIERRDMSNMRSSPSGGLRSRKPSMVPADQRGRQVYITVM